MPGFAPYGYGGSPFGKGGGGGGGFGGGGGSPYGKGGGMGMFPPGGGMSDYQGQFSQYMEFMNAWNDFLSGYGQPTAGEAPTVGAGGDQMPLPPGALTDPGQPGFPLSTSMPIGPSVGQKPMEIPYQGYQAPGGYGTSLPFPEGTGARPFPVPRQPTDPVAGFPIQGLPPGPGPGGATIPWTDRFGRNNFPGRRPTGGLARGLGQLGGRSMGLP